MNQTKTFELKPCWVVEGWATEAIEGLGCPISFTESYYKENRIMFFPKDKPDEMYVHLESKVFFNREQAFRRLEHEKDEYVKYLIKQEKEAKEKLSKLSINADK
jgi:hypothetical protein